MSLNDGRVFVHTGASLAHRRLHRRRVLELLLYRPQRLEAIGINRRVLPLVRAGGGLAEPQIPAWERHCVFNEVVAIRAEADDVALIGRVNLLLEEGRYPVVRELFGF